MPSRPQVTSRCSSPLRYPGGKSKFAPFLAGLITANAMEGCIFAEPYAGGAGAAVNLLLSGVASRAMLNDADPCIAAFWQAVIGHTDEFLRLLHDTPVTVDEWRRQREVRRHRVSESTLAVGFSTFYLNRTNRSGILNGGPIGGLDQTGTYAIGARYNTEQLKQRIEALGEMGHRIQVFHEDALDFIEDRVGPCAAQTLIYLDPPYFDKAQTLYMAYYEPGDHAILADYLCRNRQFAWCMSYDDSSAIRSLYAWCSIEATPIRYSARQSYEGREIRITPPHIRMPVQCPGPRQCSRAPSLSLPSPSRTRNRA